MSREFANGPLDIDDLTLSDLDVEFFLASNPVISDALVRKRDEVLLQKLDVAQAIGEGYSWKEPRGQFFKKADGTQEHKIVEVEFTDPDQSAATLKGVITNLGIGIGQAVLLEKKESLVEGTGREIVVWQNSSGLENGTY